MKMITNKTLLGLIVASLVLLFGTITYAKTPDGVPPSQESDCAGLPGPAKGICTAFCEAQDCETLFPDLDNSCLQLLDNYVKLTGFPGPPCVCREICAEDHAACVADCNDVRDACIADCTTGICRQGCRDAADACKNGPEGSGSCDDVRSECRKACREQERDACTPVN